MNKKITTRQKLFKSLLATIGQNKICDSLPAIEKAFEILEREQRKEMVEKIEKMKYNEDGRNPLKYSKVLRDIIKKLK